MVELELEVVKEQKGMVGSQLEEEGTVVLLVVVVILEENLGMAAMLVEGVNFWVVLMLVEEDLMTVLEVNSLVALKEGVEANSLVVLEEVVVSSLAKVNLLVD